MIQVEVAIHKTDITPLGELNGYANASPLTVDGTEYAPGRVVFLGFRGGFDTKCGRWTGVMCFEECSGDVARVDLSCVDNILHPGEVDDALYIDNN